MVQRGKRPAPSTPLTNYPLARQAVAAIARKNTLAKTRGNYPAATRAIEVATAALGVSEAEGLRLERDAFVELARTDAARNLMGIFFLQERAKKTKAELATAKAAPVKKIAVVGAGLMGAGIAQWSAGRGLRVLLKDINPGALSKGMQSIAKIFQDAAKRRVFTQADAQAGYDRVVPTAVDVPMREVDLVIEAAVEKLDLKKKIFAGLEAQTPAGTVLATNTSRAEHRQHRRRLAAAGPRGGHPFLQPGAQDAARRDRARRADRRGDARHRAGLRQGHRQAAGDRQGFAGVSGQPRAAALHERGDAAVFRRGLRRRNHRPHHARFRDADGAAAA